MNDDARRGVSNAEWERLFQEAKGGERLALGRLIEACQERVFRFCVYLAGKPELAQDLCQETLIRALENLPKIKDPKGFPGWLFKTARNLHLDHLRRAQNQEYTPIEDMQDVLPGAIPEDRDRVLQIQRALSALDPEDRFLLLLVDLEGCSYLEAAMALGIKEQSVSSKLARAREEFRNNINNM